MPAQTDEDGAYKSPPVSLLVTSVVVHPMVGMFVFGEKSSELMHEAKQRLCEVRVALLWMWPIVGKNRQENFAEARLREASTLPCRCIE